MGYLQHGFSDCGEDSMAHVAIRCVDVPLGTSSSNGKRIAHVVSTYPPYRGGQGNVARELAERTAARGHEVTMIAPRRVESGKLRVESIQHHQPSTIHHQPSTPRARFGNAAWCPSIRRIFEDVQPDIVHFHWPFIGGIAPVLAWRRSEADSRKPIAGRERQLVVQYHMDLLAHGWRGAAFAAYQRIALPRVLRTADRVVVSSLDYAQHGAFAPHIAGLGERLMEIPLGADTKRFTPHPPAPPLPQGGGKTKSDFSPSRREGEREGVGLRAIFVGGLDTAHAFKGVPVLLAAIARVPQAQLRIIGDGNLRASYEARARALGLSDRVVFLGQVSDDDLPRAYRDADILVLPSTTRSEAFGVVLLEAMASGIPVIASDLPGVRTVVDVGKTGFLVPPGDADALAERLRACAAESDRLRTMGTAARARVEARYGWDRVIAQWMQLYAV